MFYVLFNLKDTVHLLLCVNSETLIKIFFLTSLLRKNVKEILFILFKSKTKATLDGADNL